MSTHTGGEIEIFTFFYEDFTILSDVCEGNTNQFSLVLCVCVCVGRGLLYLVDSSIFFLFIDNINNSINYKVQQSSPSSLPQNSISVDDSANEIA